MKYASIVLALAFMAPGASADYLMASTDAEATGTVDPVSSWQTLLRYEWDGRTTPGAQPLIIGEAVYVFIDSPGPVFGEASRPNQDQGIWRINVTTGAADHLVSMRQAVPGTASLSSDGASLFTTDGTSFFAFDLDGNLIGQAPLADLEAPVACGPGVPNQGLVFLQCGTGFDPTEHVEYSAQDQATPGAAFVAAFRADGSLAWRWWMSTQAGTTGDGTTPSEGQSIVAASRPVIAGDVVVASFTGTHHEFRNCNLLDGMPTPDHGISIVGLAVKDGAFQWLSRGPNLEAYSITTDPANDGLDGQQGVVAHAMVVDGYVIVPTRHEALELDPATGCGGTAVPRARMPNALSDSTYHAPAGLAFAGNTLAFAYGREVFFVDRDREDIRMGQALDSDDSLIYTVRPLIAGDQLLVATTQAIHGYSVATGERTELMDTRDRVRAVGMPLHLSVAGGIAVHQGDTGIVTIIGDGPAAILPAVTVTDAWPEPGQSFEIDVSGTRPGIQSQGFETRIRWSITNVTGWSSSPSFSHVFPDIGPRTITIDMRNEAGQTATTSLLIDVGGTPPHDPTPLERAFSAENQELSFFILGLLATAIFAAFGLLRLRRRRGILRREMDAIEAAYAATSDDPLACEQTMLEERDRIRAEFRQGALDDGQYGVLKDRIDELSRGVRIDVIEQGFGFLPVSIANALRGMLDDGRVSAWERDMFVEAIERDPNLVGSQKKRVRRLVDDWFSRDAQ